MCLDIEHFLKVALIQAVEQSPSEDGYSIVLDYLFDTGNSNLADRTKTAATRSRSLATTLNVNHNNPYCSGLVAKYNTEMPIWAFVEIISFGELLRFLEYASQKIGWVLPVEIRTLDRVRQLRNASAHNNCIINDLSASVDETGHLKFSEPVHITQFVRQCGVGRIAMRKKLSNRRFSQFIHLLYAYNLVVKSSNSRQSRLIELKNLVNTRMLQNKDYFAENSLMVSTYDALSKIINTLN